MSLLLVLSIANVFVTKKRERVIYLISFFIFPHICQGKNDENDPQIKISDWQKKKHIYTPKY